MASNTSGAIRDRRHGDRRLFEIYNAESFTVDFERLLPRRSTRTTRPSIGFRPTANTASRPAASCSCGPIKSPGRTRRTGRNLHVNFKLDVSGGSIALFAPDGLTLIDSITYGQQTSDVSQGRFADGASTIYTLARLHQRGQSDSGYNTRPVFPTLANQFVFPTPPTRLTSGPSTRRCRSKC